MSSVNSGVSGPNFRKFSHDIEASFRSVNAHYKNHDIAISFLALVQRMQVVFVDFDNIFATLFRCHGNVP